MEKVKTIELVELLNSINTINDFLAKQEKQEENLNQVKDDFNRVQKYLLERIEILNNANILSKVNL